MLYDNSANSQLSCLRKAQLSLFYGVDCKASPEMRFGSAVHRVLECIAKKHVDGVDENNHATPFTTPLNDNLLCKHIQLCKDATNRHELNSLQLPKFKELVRWLLARDLELDTLATLHHGAPAAEVKFRVTDDKRYPGIEFCGTIDRLDIIDQVIYITDYKCTKSKYPSDYLRDYKLKSQIPFYLWIIENYGSQFLPSSYIGMPLAGRIRGIFYEGGFDIRDGETMLWNNHHRRQIQFIINHMTQQLHWVAEHHKRDVLAPKTGMATGACYRCPHEHICMMHDDKTELDYIKTAPKTTYNPLNFR